MSGASILQIAWRITCSSPGRRCSRSLLILFVRAIESFEVPALLGLPVGIHVYHLGDLPGDPPVSEPDRARVGLRDHAARCYAASASTSQSRLSYQGSRYLHRHRQGLPPAHHRSRPLALVRGGAVRRSISCDRAAAVPGAGVDVAAEVLHARRPGRRSSRLTLDNYRSVLDYPQLLDHGAEQPVPVAGMRHDHHAGHRGDLPGWWCAPRSRALAARQPGLDAARVSRASCSGSRS